MLNKLIFNKGQKLEIEVFTKHEFLLDIEDTRPKSAKSFIPDWWKTMPRTSGVDDPLNGTVKFCPSFVQMFSQGVVLPMWSDTILSHDEDNVFHWKTSTSAFQWEFHADWQLIDHIKMPEYKKVYKAICPWFIRTPPNVSIFQFPMMFHFNKDWTIMPGVLNTDFYYQLNQQLIYTSDKNQVMISRGTPFVWYIPFVRTEFDYKTFVADAKLQQEVVNQADAVNTKFTGHYLKEIKKRNII